MRFKFQCEPAVFTEVLTKNENLDDELTKDITTLFSSIDCESLPKTDESELSKEFPFASFSDKFAPNSIVKVEFKNKLREAYILDWLSYIFEKVYVCVPYSCYKCEYYIVTTTLKESYRLEMNKLWRPTNLATFIDFIYIYLQFLKQILILEKRIINDRVHAKKVD